MSTPASTGIPKRFQIFIAERLEINKIPELMQAKKIRIDIFLLDNE